jgi:hypothetical protein
LNFFENLKNKKINFKIVTGFELLKMLVDCQAGFGGWADV